MTTTNTDSTAGVLTDEQIIQAALRHYNHFLSDSACAMAQKTFRLPSGREPDADEISKVLDGAKRCAEILIRRAAASSQATGSGGG